MAAVFLELELIIFRTDERVFDTKVLFVENVENCLRNLIFIGVIS